MVLKSKQQKVSAFFFLILFLFLIFFIILPVYSIFLIQNLEFENIQKGKVVIDSYRFFFYLSFFILVVVVSEVVSLIICLFLLIILTMVIGLFTESLHRAPLLFNPLGNWSVLIQLE